MLWFFPYRFLVRLVLCCRTNDTVLICLISVTGQFLDKKGVTSSFSMRESILSARGLQGQGCDARRET